MSQDKMSDWMLVDTTGACEDEATFYAEATFHRGGIAWTRACSPAREHWNDPWDDRSIGRGLQAQNASGVFGATLTGFVVDSSAQRTVRTSIRSAEDEPSEAEDLSWLTQSAVITFSSEPRILTLKCAPYVAEDQSPSSWEVVFVGDYSAVWEPAKAPVWRHRDENRVRAYLEASPEIPGLLRRTEPSIARLFGDEVEVVLEVISYVDEGSHDELVAWIQCRDDVETGLAKFEQFVDSWADELWGAVGCTFNYNIEFPNEL